MNGASDQPEEFGVQPEQGRQEEPQSNAGSAADATATSDATASPEDSTSSAPHSRRVRRRMSAEHIRQIKRKRRRRKILIGVLVVIAALHKVGKIGLFQAAFHTLELQTSLHRCPRPHAQATGSGRRRWPAPACPTSATPWRER